MHTISNPTFPCSTVPSLPHETVLRTPLTLPPWQISHLSVLLKLLEHLVAPQLRDYLTSADLLYRRCSPVFLPGHSTETAVLQVLSDILQAVDHGNSTCACPPGPISSIRHGRPWDSASASAVINHLRHPRHNSPVVSVVSALLNKVCTALTFQIIISPSDVWCDSRFSAGPPVIYFVHRWSVIIDRR